jgi:hypothetical protein
MKDKFHKFGYKFLSCVVIQDLPTTLKFTVARRIIIPNYLTLWNLTQKQVAAL